MKKQPLLNTFVNNVDMEETLYAIDTMIASGKKSYVVAINVDVVMKIEHDSYLKEITDNADMVLNIVEKEYPDLVTIAMRFGFYQRLDYLLHIPISQMTKENQQYQDIVKYLRKHRKEIKDNSELTKKQKVYLLLLSMAPVVVRKTHRMVIKCRKT